MPHLRPSNWTYDARPGNDADILIASGGTLTFIDPDGVPQHLYFGRVVPDTKGKPGRIALPSMYMPARLPEKPAEKEEPARKKGEEKGGDADDHDADDSPQGKKAPTTRVPKIIDKENGKSPEGNEKKAATEPPKPASSSIFMTDAFFGRELSMTDLRGGAVFVDALIGLISGEPVCAMLLGIHSADLMSGLSSPATFFVAQRAIAQAKAVVLMPDVTQGLHSASQAGVLTGYVN